MKAMTARFLATLLLVCVALGSNPAWAERGRTQPLGAITLIGPDGPAGRAIEGVLRGTHGALRYVGTGSRALALRSLAASREHLPADLILLDPQGAEQAYARGLIVRTPYERMPEHERLVPIARAAASLCTPLGFDALAITYLPETVQPPPRALEALRTASIRDRLALPAPSGTLGAYLVGLLARRESGDWRRTDLGLARLQTLRGESLAVDASDAAASDDKDPPASLAVAWNSAAQLERDRADHASRPGVVMPAEGTMLRPLLLCLSASAPNLQGALALIESALRPERQAALAAALYLAPARDDVVLPTGLRARVPDLHAPDALILPDQAFIARLHGAVAAQQHEFGQPAGRLSN